MDLPIYEFLFWLALVFQLCGKKNVFCQNCTYQVKLIVFEKLHFERNKTDSEGGDLRTRLNICIFKMKIKNPCKSFECDGCFPLTDRFLTLNRELKRGPV